jgi:hypothetical protein
MQTNEENQNNIGVKPRDTEVKPPGKMNWTPVLLFYAKTTSWIIFPLLLAFFGGRYVKNTIGSQVLFFAFILAGFLITCLGIYREVRVYKESLSETGGRETRDAQNF